MADVGTLVADFVADAEADGTYSREQLRGLRRELAHVAASDLGVRDAAHVSAQDVRALPATALDALRLVYAHAVDRGTLRSSPLVGLAPAVEPAAPSPTTAIVSLGTALLTWTVRAVIAGFVLAAIGLVLALA
jgi:hypothetical protein